MLALCVEEEETENQVHDDVESGAWNVMMHLNGMCWGVNFIVRIERMSEKSMKFFSVFSVHSIIRGR